MRQRAGAGGSLVEVLVAITVLAMALSIALVLYDGARRSFKVGDNLAEQQQVVRIAFDKLTRDVGLAGMNANPDGNKQRADEAIEAALETALIVRADFDASDPTRATTPEQALATPGWPVSTGNDEIVGYVLANDRSVEEFQFVADVRGVPRDGTPDPIDVSDIAIQQDDPPYTLYRVTIEEDSASVRRVPLVDNVRALRFTYYDATGVAIPPPGGSDDEASRAARAAIQRIEISVEGLTRDPDSRWADRSDPLARTREYRKFALAADVTPINLGLFGMRDLGASLAPPSPPAPPILHPGHCKGLWVEWSPNPAHDEVARYEIYYGLDDSCALGPRYSASAGAWLDGLDDAKPYFVKIVAVDDSGNASAPSLVVSESTENKNTPEQVQDLAATGDLNSAVELSWAAATENAQPAEPTADPINPDLRDFDRYFVYRREGLADWARAAETALPEFRDEQVVNCRDYTYRVTASDLCGREGEVSAEVSGRGSAAVMLEIPANLQAYVIDSTVRLVWDPVTRDVEGNKIYVEDYIIRRSDSLEFQVSRTTEFIDPLFVSGVSYQIKVKDDCNNSSLFSDAVAPTCSFVGTLAFVSPSAGPIAHEDPIQVDLTGGDGSYELSLSILKDGFPVFGPAALGPGPPWRPLGFAPTEPGLYAIRATTTAGNGCKQTRGVVVEVLEPPGGE